MISIFLSTISPPNENNYISSMFIGVWIIIFGVIILAYVDSRPMYVSCRVIFAGELKDEFPVGPFRGHQVLNDWKTDVMKHIESRSRHPEHTTLNAIDLEFTEIPDYEFDHTARSKINPGSLTSAILLVRYLVDEQYYLP